jgi:hypothetical protein
MLRFLALWFGPPLLAILALLLTSNTLSLLLADVAGILALTWLFVAPALIAD